MGEIYLNYTFLFLFAFILLVFNKKNLHKEIDNLIKIVNDRRFIVNYNLIEELVRNYEESNESLKDIKNLIIESNIISLSSYLNERLSC